MSLQQEIASANLARPGDAGGRVDVTVVPRGDLVVFQLAGKAPAGTPAEQIETIELVFTVDETIRMIEQAVDAVDRITQEGTQVSEACNALRRLMTIAYAFGSYGVDLRRE